MTMAWVPIFDDSFQRIPVKNYPAVYAAGYRVMAGYVAGGSNPKWVTKAEVAAWLACGSDTGFLPLFEGVGDEPATSPTSGTEHAKAARAGCRARGVPDTAAVSPAMDRNVTLTQAKGPIATYMREWKAADTMPPLPYIELDAGAALHTAGLTVGTGTPAAYSWDPSDKLVTPDNAPAHVLWTQEHNGVALHGGSVDIGHIRDSAPIMRSDDMAISWDDQVVDSGDPSNPKWSVDGTLKWLVANMRTVLTTTAADAKVDTASAAAVTALTTLIKSAGGDADSAAIIAAMNTAIAAEGVKESATVAALSNQVAKLQADLVAAAQASAAALAK